uniref:Uncharacterized protein n=1 Tax=Anguilla anguilla TaxID=7936 RepID=A0A0E9VCG8_ANGAN
MNRLCVCLLISGYYFLFLFCRGF